MEIFPLLPYRISRIRAAFVNVVVSSREAALFGPNPNPSSPNPIPKAKGQMDMELMLPIMGINWAKIGM
jgi:hypothetical protein